MMAKSVLCTLCVLLAGGSASWAGVGTLSGGHIDTWKTYTVLVVSVEQVGELKSSDGAYRDVHVKVIRSLTPLVKDGESISVGVRLGVGTSLVFGIEETVDGQRKYEELQEGRTYLLCVHKGKDGAYFTSPDYVSFMPRNLPIVSIKGPADPAVARTERMVAALREPDEEARAVRVLGLVREDPALAPAMYAVLDIFRIAVRGATRTRIQKELRAMVDDQALKDTLRLSADGLLDTVDSEYRVSAEREPFLRRLAASDDEDIAHAAKFALRELRCNRILRASDRDDQLIALIESEEPALLAWAINRCRDYKVARAVPAIQAYVERERLRGGDKSNESNRLINLESAERALAALKEGSAPK